MTGEKLPLPPAFTESRLNELMWEFHQATAYQFGDQDVKAGLLAVLQELGYRV